jgi:molybdenum transport protein
MIRPERETSSTTGPDALYPLPDDLLDRLLAEDVPHGDLTTLGLGIQDAQARMTFSARRAMVVACAGDAARLVTRRGAAARTLVPDGGRVAAGTILLEAEGGAGALFSTWKVAQTLVEAASGIATATRSIVDAACAVRPSVVVAGTRKAFPGARAISVKALVAGGGTPHRLGLSETLLVFPQHRRFLSRPLGAWVSELRVRHPDKKVVVETTSLDEALALADAGVDVLQLERFAPGDVHLLVEALAVHGRRPVVAATGGVDATNAAAYAAAGADVLVTSAPYHAAPSDVQVLIEPP